jgi:hypothetical protein
MERRREHKQDKGLNVEKKGRRKKMDKDFYV